MLVCFICFGEKTGQSQGWCLARVLLTGDGWLHVFWGSAPSRKIPSYTDLADKGDFGSKYTILRRRHFLSPKINSKRLSTSFLIVRNKDFNRKIPFNNFSN
jgi:hypothetical protein